jgi:hypothetical protein
MADRIVSSRTIWPAIALIQQLKAAAVDQMALKKNAVCGEDAERRITLNVET